uniref:Uncharacterized protein n=1 Tax=Candidatus Kentrum sp. TUN TaxID=2126343 RepID=A0A450ZZN1_9GAMM|nr:MAG: hypothetical protein BECKTUN1418F_GA0071002_11675 [Candidatus Kentron sp. TUN]VFK62752.1 MAG: hypothetical protein BECKTUN1418D_GA0071000_11863 [Candidatus Kentron sp. TUN]VFK67826.1 MAG: hypothetical protein BECKTUN1418E_GA0071001_11615 [Candidatus Kentron sp. TUN]
MDSLSFFLGVATLPSPSDYMKYLPVNFSKEVNLYRNLVREAVHHLRHVSLGDVKPKWRRTSLGMDKA